MGSKLSASLSKLNIPKIKNKTFYQLRTLWLSKIIKTVDYKIIMPKYVTSGNTGIP